jgi:pyruvate formate lyase activating enzyme
MDFSGWEKLSLLDYDHKVTATLFMAGCDFRCPFCHNSSLVLTPKTAPTVPWTEIMSYLRKRVGMLDAVCVTGGEPTLMPDLKDKLRDIKSLGYPVKLDSNGSHPEVIKDLVQEKLIDYLAMDIKNSPEKYSMTAGAPVDMKKIQETISFLISGSLDYEFRTTTILEYHNEKDFAEIASWLKGASRYFIQKYIDNENCIAHGLHPISKEQALSFAALLRKTISAVELRGFD